MSVSGTKLTRDETLALVLKRLQDAAAAHGIYEAAVLGGRHDEAWPKWYSEHMVDALGSESYEVFKQS